MKAEKPIRETEDPELKVTFYPEGLALVETPPGYWKGFLDYCPVCGKKLEEEDGNDC